MEIWKEISGYEGHYEVSSLGRVRMLPRILFRTGVWVSRTRLLKQRIIKTERGRGEPYLRMAVDLTTGAAGDSKTYFIGRLVATAFIPNPKMKPLVMYKDFNSRNNNVENLQWATPSENLQYASKHGRYALNKKSKGRNHALSKGVKQLYRTGRYKRTFFCITEASKITGIGRTSIQDALSGRSETAGGFIWKYSKKNNILKTIKWNSKIII